MNPTLTHATPAARPRRARRARRAKRSLVRFRTRASCRRGRAPSTCPCPIEVCTTDELHIGDSRHSAASSSVPASSSTSTSLHLSKQQTDATLKAHVAIVCFNSSRCFQRMLQVLYITVVKVDRDIAHVVITIHVCFKCMFQMFHLFQTNVASVLS
jgi:hypothetical protein